MEAAAMDKLVEKGEFRLQVAQAIAEAIDITIKAANLVTVPMLDARFAQCEAKMEARFSALEKTLEATKVWAVLLYAGLTIALCGALALDHHWIVNREDQLMGQVQAHFAEQQARSDARFAQQQARSDVLFAQQQARSDALFAEQRARSEQLFQQTQARMDARFDELRTLLLSLPRKAGSADHHRSSADARRRG